MPNAAILFGLCLYLSWVDLRQKRIPNRALGAGLVLISIMEYVLSSPMEWLMAGFYAILCLLVFGWISWYRPLALGMGDVKLFALVCYGLGVRDFVVVLTVASLVALLVSLVWLLIRKGSIKSEVPFAPFVTIGLAVLLFMSETS
ncbi:MULTISPECIES: A24 family peptidase [Brevibacillus]|uniref:prepilin peptidase n=1 Tax=Brevibacillus TaxID=55080 RepID=UPI000D0F3FB3|nr:MULTISPECIES: A24 family peptidase [Brevibacillus]MED1946169.1 A24 family peptidase [Brevibacillus formosus]MED1998909.1 A24 family peptidase [Brevibacillus formosus]MED2084034.1 A24 family peptidase [Brevibacillus formosus]PSK18084.1 prepilin peptidase [Brevibacillus sp. NRRL NRS-603]